MVVRWVLVCIVMATRVHQVVDTMCAHLEQKRPVLTVKPACSQGAKLCASPTQQANVVVSKLVYTAAKVQNLHHLGLTATSSALLKISFIAQLQVHIVYRIVPMLTVFLRVRKCNLSCHIHAAIWRTAERDCSIL